MSFTSFHFLGFIVVAFVLARLTARNLAWRNWTLLVASYYFYMCWDWRFAGLLGLNTLLHFLLARRIARSGHAGQRRGLLILGVVASLGILAYFKYASFFIDSGMALLHGLGIQADAPLLQVILPIGISFYTFQILSYTLDVYRRTQAPCNSLRDFALFCAFFPTVLSGPITRARILLPQLQAPTSDEPERVEQGLVLMLRGFVKKVAFADVLALHIVNPAFTSPGDYSGWFLLLAVYAYSFQIYMDLSGYTDIARGSAQLLGFHLPENFNRPYLADSVSNFWQRWHITMSGFFRDYLYFGIGGSKQGNVYLNLLITFLAIGMWHGAGWSFLLYGLIHGSVVGLERWARNRRARLHLPPLRDTGGWWALRVFVTFQIVAFSRILFRADDLPAAWAYVRAMLGGNGTAAPLAALPVLVLLLAVVLHYLPARWSTAGMQWVRTRPPWLLAVLVVATLYGLVAFSSGEAAFVYFQF